MITDGDLARIERWRTDPAGMREEERAREVRRIADRRLWAAIVLARDLDVCRSILLGRPVLARRLDPRALRLALRGERPPGRDSWFRVRAGHLDAVAEGGPLPEPRFPR